MRPETGCVSFVAHVANEELAVGMTPLQLRFEMTEAHHARSETVSKQNHARALIKREWLRGMTTSSEEAFGEQAT